jgi:hypothetical protein
MYLTLRQTWTQETRNLLDESVGGDESIVLAGKLLDQFLVLVELLQIVRGHSIDTTVLSTINIVLITENAFNSNQPKPSTLCPSCVLIGNIPDAHSWARDDWETNGSTETLVTLGIIVLEADLKFDGFEEVSLLSFKGVFEETLNVGTHSGCGAQKLA